MNKVELRPAYVWDCDNCGKENFHSAVVKEMAEADRKEMMEDMGIPEDELGDFIMLPQMVECCGCQTRFEAQHWGEELEEE